MNGCPTLLSTESEYVTLSHLDDQALIVILPLFKVACEQTR